MTTPTDFELRRFWEKCGFWKHEYKTIGVIMNVTEWLYPEPDGELHDELPALTLDNLFKYAVPKVKFITLKGRYESAKDFEAEAWGTWDMLKSSEPFRDADPALALYHAINEALQEEK